MYVGFVFSVGILETETVIIATSVLKTSGRMGVISCHGPTVCVSWLFLVSFDLGPVSFGVGMGGVTGMRI